MVYSSASSAASGRFQVRCSSQITALALVGTTPACINRASVVLDAISLGSPEASITAYTLNPAALASSAGNITQTLVHTPPIIKVRLPVSCTVLTKSALSQALTSPLRGTWTACGAASWISGMGGPLGPSGTEAVVISGISSNAANFARAIVLDRNSATLMSLTF